MSRKAFRVQAVDDINGAGIATGIQVIIPDGLNFEQAKQYALKYITGEMERYFLGEALRHVGLEPQLDA